MATMEQQALDADAARYVEMARSSSRPSFESLSVADARAFYRAARDTANLPSIEVGNVEDDYLGGRGGSIAVRRYLPATIVPGPQPAVLFFHGGGWVIGDLDTHDSICRHIVAATGLQLIAVDYRLGPEHRFPAAVDDATDTHAMLINRADAWDIDPGRIILAGDSAGGALALVTALQARDMCRPLPIAQGLFYPVADLRGETASYAGVRDVPITAATMTWFRDCYLADPAAAADWRASPLLASSYASVPPTFITVCGADPLHDEGMALASRLYTSGVPVLLRHLPGQVHGYLTLGRLIEEAGATIEAFAGFVRKQLDCRR